MAAHDDKCVNILLLGETGSGKSTFVNAIINYVYYNGLDDAVRGKVDVGPIRMKFTMYDSFGELHDIQSEVNDDNENLNSPGESATKRSKTYLLKSKYSQVRLIDTPGIGDTKGLQQDKENLRNILEIISNFETIHGIVVILKSNETRLTTNFTYCLTQLMAELHRSAAKNIVFIFTHGRGSHYKPGDTLVVLRKLLSDIEQLPSKVKIPLDKNNMFVVDNEAIRYIHSQRIGIQLTQEEVKNYQTSWEKSSNQCQRLIQHLRDVEPHSMRNLVSVSEARNSISLLQQPLLQILAGICDYQTVLSNHKETIKECENDIDKLRSRIYVPGVKTEMTKLSVPQTVCKSDKCRQTYTVHGLEKPYFPQVCCKDCYVDYSLMSYNFFVSVVNFVSAVIPYVNTRFHFFKFINIPTLSNDEDMTPMRWFCQSMTYGGTCKVCGCNTSEHELEYYNWKLVEETCEDPTVTEDISKKVDVKQQSERVLSEINTKLAEMSGEKDMVLDAVAHFAYFLENNAIVPYWDVFEHVLDELNSNSDAPDEKMNSVLQSVLNDYRGKKEAVRNRYQDSLNPQAAVSPDDIKAWMDKLTHMKMHGDLVGQGMTMTENASRCQQRQRYHEMEFNVPDESWFQ